MNGYISELAMFILVDSRIMMPFQLISPFNKDRRITVFFVPADARSCHFNSPVMIRFSWMRNSQSTVFGRIGSVQYKWSFVSSTTIPYTFLLPIVIRSNFSTCAKNHNDPDPEHRGASIQSFARFALSWPERACSLNKSRIGARFPVLPPTNRSDNHESVCSPRRGIFLEAEILMTV